ncbi:MAG: leucyl aminopeptidase family protein [Rhodospirillales bacterium]
MAWAARTLDCLAPAGSTALPVYAVRPACLPGFLEGLPARAANYLRASSFVAKAGTVVLLPGSAGLAGAVLGLGETAGPHPFGALPFALPERTVWRFAGPLDHPHDAALGFCLGAYRFDHLKSAPGRAPSCLVPPPGTERALTIATITWLVRDLINLPANLLGPAELAVAAADALSAAGAEVTIMEGEHLHHAYPLLAAVGEGSARAPRVVKATWNGANRGANATAPLPLISLCGKGVCFDTGGYDLKQPASMLRMKKDMGGAAIALGVALLAIAEKLPVRLEVRLGCVENSVSGAAMRPLDVIRSRRGLTVSIGNTDAEGRLVLADLLAEASDSAPDLLLDFATLTGAARVALGPDIAALFCNDDRLASSIETAARLAHDPVWRLPLWSGYDHMLEGTGCDLTNVADKPYAGAVVAALFLQRFLAAGTRWAHFDVYAWNDALRSGRPEGGEAQSMRAAFEFICRFVHLGGNDVQAEP